MQQIITIILLTKAVINGSCWVSSYSGK